jgi:hypothetical protein
MLQAQQPLAHFPGKPYGMTVAVTVIQMTPVPASVKRVHSPVGRKELATRLLYGEKTVIGRDDKLQHLVRARMKDLERGTVEIGMFILWEYFVPVVN